jgi:acetyl esterase/lipase
VIAVAAAYAPSDLATIAGDIDSMPDDSREAQLVGAPLRSVPDRVAQASPLSHVRAGAPPFLLLHGRDDQFIPCSQSERLRDALEQAGTRSSSRSTPGPTTCGEAHRAWQPTRWTAPSTSCSGCWADLWSICELARRKVVTDSRTVSIQSCCL